MGWPRMYIASLSLPVTACGRVHFTAVFDGSLVDTAGVGGAFHCIRELT